MWRRGSFAFSIPACLALLLVTLVGSIPQAVGATRAERQQSAEQCVRQALTAEAAGRYVSRDSLLQAALDAVPNYEPALWHSGQVRFRRGWVSFDQVPHELADDHRLIRYERARALAQDTAAAQFELAEWCRRRGLEEQGRAHLARVVALQPDHAEARDRLGFVRRDDQWIAAADIAAAETAERRRQRHLRQWRRTVEQLAARLEHPREEFRATARRDLLAVDAAAVAAVEEVLFQQDEALALVGVEVLANIDTLAATEALARQSLTAARPQVRREAAKQLKRRDYSHFVPALLGELQTEIEAERQLFTTSSGRLIHRHLLVNESQDQRQAVVVETQYQRGRRPGGDGRDTLDKALENVAENDFAREIELSRRNVAIEETNERVMDALHWAVDEDFHEPAECWAWWDAYNEVYRPETKQLASLVRSQSVTVQDDVPVWIGSQGGGSVSVTPTSADCLAAGTPVWTSRGLRAIEQIEIGDLVLSQDVETGELAYKPVLQTTAL